MLVYEMDVIAVGEAVLEYLAKERLLVTFEEGVPEELAEISAVHRHGPLASPVQVGDLLVIDGKRYPVTAVGDVANVNLRNLGHIIIRFDGEETPALPGNMHVRGEPLGTLGPGSRIEILREGDPA